MEILTYPFVQRAIIGGVCISLLLSILGVYVVLKRLSFIGVGISHSAFGGVALGLLLNLNPILSAVLFAWLVAILIWVSKKSNKSSEDSLIGIYFSFTMALGVIFIGFNKNYTADIFSYLFGDILAITQNDLIFIIIVTAIVLLIIYGLYKELLYFVFDEESAKVSGLPTDFIYFILLTIITFSIVVSIKIVGIILVSAFLVIPASTALFLTHDFKKFMFLSVLIGVISTIIGFLLSYVFNLASGATIVVTATVIFIIINIFYNIKYR